MPSLHDAFSDKQCPHNNKWKSDHQNDLKAYQEGIIHSVIVLVNEGTHHNPDDGKDNSANHFPFPGDQ